MSVKESKILLKKETVIVQEAEVTIQKLIDMFTSSMSNCLDSYYISQEEPVLDTDGFDEEVTVRLSKGDDADIEGIISDVEMLFEESLEKHIEDESARLKELETKTIVKKTPVEEGEGGQL
jgi:hypothetical protein